MKDLHQQLMDIFNNEYPPHKYVPRNDKDLKNYIISLTPFLKEDSTISERLYCIKNDYNPICENGKQRSFISFKDGYRNGCAAGTNCICAQKSRSSYATKLNIERKDQLLESQRQTFFNRMIEKCNENNIEALFGIDEYNGTKQIYKWKCKICNHTFEKHIENGSYPVCKNCHPPLSNSKEQDEVYDWLKSAYNGKILKNVRNVLDYGMEIDIYLPDLNVGIEYNGNYYHSDKFVDKGYHKRKISLAYSKNIKLLSFFSDEWKYNQDIVKSLIIHNLGLKTNYVHARKCELKKVLWKDISKFIEQNHLQGSGRPTNINYGLYYEDKLLSVMTFSITEKHNCQYELVRYCSSMRVNGGASKLFHQFIKDFGPSSILSYNDNRIGSGKLYHNLGFKFVDNTKPGYFWIDKNNEKRLSRTKFTKKTLISMGYDSSKTEEEIMKEIGYLKIYDAGHRVFIWNKE